MTASNPYTPVTISGYNASSPADDGSRVASNQIEWQKHVDKLGDPLKTLAEDIDTNVNAGFGALVITDDPGQETVIVAMAMYG